MPDDLETKVEREVAYLLKGWESVEYRTPEQELQFEADKIEAIRIAQDRAKHGRFECPTNIPPKEHYGALEPEERKEVDSGS